MNIELQALPILCASGTEPCEFNFFNFFSIGQERVTTLTNEYHLYQFTGTKAG